MKITIFFMKNQSLGEIIFFNYEFSVALLLFKHLNFGRRGPTTTKLKLVQLDSSWICTFYKLSLELLKFNFLPVQGLNICICYILKLFWFFNILIMLI